MGAHHNQQIHRRAAAAKQRRLADDDVDGALLKSLVARFSPTAVYTETETNAGATDTATDANTPATNTPARTPPAPPPVTTTPPAAPTLPTTTAPADTNTDTAPTPTLPLTTDLPPPVDQTTSDTDTAAPPPLTTAPTITTQQSITPLSTLASISADSSAASSTPSDTPGTGTNVGGIIGGIAGALLGLTVLVFVVRFLVKRHQRRNDEDGAAAFNANDFRRSAVLMNDPPTHNETVERGFNPRPPTMIERRLASPAPTFGTQYGAPGPYEATGGNEYGNMDQYGQYQSYGPGQMNNMSPPVSATSAHPMYPNQAYGQSPFSPIASPVSARGPGYDGGQAAVLTRQPSSATQLSRNNSAGANGYPQDNSAQFANYPNHPNQNLSAQNEYVDLDRSSVTPYQAAQYAEISMRLNTDVPAGLDTPAVNQFVRSSNEGAPPVPANDHSSPFADPAPAALPAALLAGSGRGAQNPRDSVSRDIDEFPAPPSPAHSSRVDSTPPMLPEIHVDSRTTSYDFPASAQGSPIASGYPSGVAKDFTKSPLGSQFPATPSPMASSFGIATPPAAATSFPDAAPAAEVKSEKKRPDTVYDDEDAYGGF